MIATFSTKKRGVSPAKPPPDSRKRANALASSLSSNFSII